MTGAPPTTSDCKLDVTGAPGIRSSDLVRRLESEIAKLKPLVEWGMKINSRRYLPLADRLERLETEHSRVSRAGGRSETAHGTDAGPTSPNDPR